jgi:ATP-binding cassette subfamily E protein 1
VIGIIGENGVGKTTLINILSQNIIPNFESRFALDLKTIISKFRGSVLYDYLKALYENKLTISIKLQKIKNFLENISVKKFMETCNELDNLNSVIKSLELDNLMEKQLDNLSGCELQQVLCARIICSKLDVYIFDEPSNYLDIKQRLMVTKLIREIKLFDFQFRLKKIFDY